MWEIGIIDDDVNVRKLLNGVVREAGYEPGEFESGLEFFDYVQKNPLDNLKLLIVDILMPEFSGTEMVQQLSEKGILHNIPILFLSALKDDEEVVKAHEAANLALTADYLQKPFKKGWILARILNLLKIKQYNDELLRMNEKAMQTNMELNKLASITTNRNEYLAGLNAILKDEKNGIQKKYTMLVDQMQQVIIHDLPIVKFVTSILEKNTDFIMETTTGISEEDELFKILPQMVKPLKGVASDIEKTVSLLMNLGILKKTSVLNFDISDTVFYKAVQRVYDKGGLSGELRDDLLKMARIDA
jgi:DNA-binding response OmpR family regulator